jgi:hypothetical protein
MDEKREEVRIGEIDAMEARAIQRQRVRRDTDSMLEDRTCGKKCRDA